MNARDSLSDAAQRRAGYYLFDRLRWAIARRSIRLVFKRIASHEHVSVIAAHTVYGGHFGARSTSESTSAAFVIGIIGW